jgi:hypothetical protein
MYFVWAFGQQRRVGGAQQVFMIQPLHQKRDPDPDYLQVREALGQECGSP